MIVGIGTDIIEISRIKRAIERTKGFLERNFSEKELLYFKKRNFKVETIAGNFAAKEAVSKAIGTGFRGISLINIEVIRDELGKPLVLKNEKIKKVLLENGIEKFEIHVSISHNNENAIAYAILEK